MHLGDGKSHYICKKMAGPNPSAVVTFDESFSIEEAIENLQSLSLKTNAVVYFNFTLLPANVSWILSCIILCLFCAEVICSLCIC